MSTNDESPDQDVDERLAAMGTRAEEFRLRCLNRSAVQLTENRMRLARREQRLNPLLDAQFVLIVQTQQTFQHHRGCEVAIEMISLLESPDHARRIQHDYPEDEYAHRCGWMTACAYDNLAKHTASIHGYNSEGMHQCIADGIEICHRTGKLQCINCFREYACAVHVAADDIEMALHQTSVVAATRHETDFPDHHRWYAGYEKSRILSLLGDLEGARQSLLAALDLAAGSHSPFSARLATLTALEGVLWMMGQSRQFEEIAHEPLGTRGIPPGECPEKDLAWDFRDAIAACCQGAFERAIELLSRWDRKLLEEGLSHLWFETRLRLIAALRLAGQVQRMDPLAELLVQRAKKARDWLTLRRLRTLVDPTSHVTPLATLGAARVGPFGTTVSLGGPVAVSGEVADAAADEAPAVPTSPATPTPMHDVLHSMFARAEVAEDDAAMGAILREILDLSLEPFSDPRDAAQVLLLIPYLFTTESPFDEIWEFARRLAALFPQSSYVVNLLATLAHALCGWPAESMQERIPLDYVAKLFRQSLDLEPDNAPNHSRAADFHFDQENLGEAERCLARAFRLCRDDGILALKLADIHERTSRPRDALAILDLCLRAGCQEANVAWEAAMTAHRVDQHEAMLTYLDRFDALEPEQAWVGYYRALGHLSLGNHAAALEALDREERLCAEHAFAIALLRACVAGSLGETEQFRAQLGRTLAFSWSAIDYMTMRGLLESTTLLWNAAACLPHGDEQVEILTRRLLAAGLCPDEHFESLREQVDEEPVSFFRCTLMQPLDDRWGSSPGCLHAQENWKTYHCLWGVLARDEDEACRLAIAQQAECHHLSAIVTDVEELSSDLVDKPGITWQGQRWNDDEQAREE